MKSCDNYKINFAKKIDKILNKINVIPLDKLDSLVGSIFEHEKSIVISFLNFQAMNLSRKNNELYLSIIQSDYLFRDGVAIEKFQKLLSIEPGYNLNGTDFIPLLIDEAIKQNKPIVLWGTSESNLKLARDNIQQNGGCVEDICDGFQEHDTYIRRASNISDNALIILGMGMPKQEVLSMYLNTSSKRIIVNGGAFIDFTSGNVKRAPKLIIKYKLEWLFRLLNEPKRLFKRTIIGGGWFVLYSIFFVFKKKCSKVFES